MPLSTWMRRAWFPCWLRSSLWRACKLSNDVQQLLAQLEDIGRLNNPDEIFAQLHRVGILVSEANLTPEEKKLLGVRMSGLNIAAQHLDLGLAT